MIIEKIINLTPHTVCVCDARCVVAEIESSGVARCSVSSEVIGYVEVNGIPVDLVTSVLADVTGLPAPCAGTLFVVARVVAMAAHDRSDLVVPDDLVRDDQGRVIGCRRFARV
jgi:hypothetical protein